MYRPVCVGPGRKAPKTGFLASRLNYGKHKRLDQFSFYSFSLLDKVYAVLMFVKPEGDYNGNVNTFYVTLNSGYIM